jgi:hypothetical protein
LKKLFSSLKQNQADYDSILRGALQTVPRVTSINHPIPHPSRGAIFTSANSGITTNWADNTVTFNKVLFTKPIRIITDPNTQTDFDGTIVQAARDGIIRFEDCQFYTTSTTYGTASTNSSVIYDIGSTVTACSNDVINMYWSAKPLTPRERFKEQLRLRMAPTIIRGRSNERQFHNVSPQEIVALQLLRGMVSAEVFKKYLRHGFITVQGESGLVYQIRRNESHVVVWHRGKKLCELCVQLNDYGIPPTDAVVSKLLICECDEIDIWRRANLYWRGALSTFQSITSKTIERKHLLQLVAA